MHLASRKRQKVKVGASSFDFRAGETIHTENSYKYSRELVQRAGARGRVDHGAGLDRREPEFRGLRADIGLIQSAWRNPPLRLKRPSGRALPPGLHASFGNSPHENRRFRAGQAFASRIGRGRSGDRSSGRRSQNPGRSRRSAGALGRRPQGACRCREIRAFFRAPSARRHPVFAAGGKSRQDRLPRPELSRTCQGGRPPEADRAVDLHALHHFAGAAQACRSSGRWSPRRSITNANC